MKRRVALLFPGQGAQSVGMGKAFAERYAVARELFEEADDLLGRHLSKTLFEGPLEVITETRNSQTGLFVVCFAAWQVIKQEFKELEPVVSAGFSLGEYTAIAASGWLPFATALKLVDFRGECMQRACEQTKGGMAAILGLSAQEVESLVQELQRSHQIWVANYNAPDQTVISGTQAAVELAIEAAKAKGARRAIPLNVHGAFHSGLMQEAGAQFAQRLQETAFAEQGLPLVMNVTGKWVSEQAELVQNLSKQMTHSVRWEQTIQTIEPQGIQLFLEVGCGQVLAGLNKRIGTKIPTLSVDAIEDLEKINKMRVESIV